ncbi:MAG: hypothetical protein M1828_002195 [Chrysothrix sp. TS-e1954]|nr:MAG: hypothetical protein M1828_002195 [Chrysothrix sp. TS-e1954]
MSSFLSRLKSNASQSSSSPTTGSLPSKRAVQSKVPLTPLGHLLEDVGPLRPDGSDKFFGMLNPSNVCYCNSVLQCLFFSEPFRDQVLKFPVGGPGDIASYLNHNDSHLDDTLLPDVEANSPRTKLSPDLAPSSPSKKPTSTPASPVPRDENKESFDYRKKQVIANGPHVRIESSNSTVYGMSESLFTGLKDVFGAIIAHQSHTGIITPVKFLEVLRRDHETYRSALHQDAHEFLNLLLNEVVERVEEYYKKIAEADKAQESEDDNKKLVSDGPSRTLEKTTGTGAKASTTWVHELFEGTLTSETRCLTCETKSQRDETFLDLSVDLEEHTSVTSCLRKFSEEEMLCERNKFHCDRCGGLQEAEKRMKIKRLPRILALHLKRFKYTEEMERLQKLFHRVVFPFHLRLLNTTDDAEDPDRLYELYAIIVHLGSTPFHGHYVSIVKTKDKGWLLFDDELVLPVDANYVRNFFGGDSRNPACAYVLFYQETTEEAVREEVFESDDVPRMEPELHHVASEPASFKPTSAEPRTPGLGSSATAVRDQSPFTSLEEAVRVPSIRTPTIPQRNRDELDHNGVDANHSRYTFEAAELSRPSMDLLKTNEKASEKEKVLTEEDPPGKEAAEKTKALRRAKSGSLGRFRTTSISLRQKPKFWSSKDKDKSDTNSSAVTEPSTSSAALPEETVEKPKSRFSLGRKKSTMLS